MGAPRNKGYKRSWRNLLLNRRYQLRFTLVMVAVSALMMVGLGWWVMKEADQATEVGKTNVDGRECPELPAPLVANVGAGGGSSATGAGPAATGAGATGGPVNEVESDSAAARRRRATVTIEESTMEMAPEVSPPPDPVVAVQPAFAELAVAHYTCKMEKAAQRTKLEAGRRRILHVLLGVGLLLCVGLAAYGLKMTHKVAGPLYKVSLYLGKMRDGRFDTVYNLRKSDQLVEFYDHFKAAHGGVRAMQAADIERLEAVIAAAEAAKLAERSPEIAALLDELRAMLARKEGSLE